MQCPMRQNVVDLETVRKTALALPGVEESTMYGSPAFKLGRKMLACVPTHRSAEPGSLVVSVDIERRSELIAGAPAVYYVTEHYQDHPVVLVRLSKIGVAELRDLLGGAHRMHSSTSRRRAKL